MNIYFLSNIGTSLACMRTSRKTSARLKITFVDMTYPKGWTGSLLLCPLIFSWYNRANAGVLPGIFRETPGRFAGALPCSLARVVFRLLASFLSLPPSDIMG